MDDTLARSLVTFFAGRPQEEALGRAVTQQLLKELPGIAVQVQKSQITFRGRYGFAALSLPRRAQDKAAHAVLLTLGLPVRLDSPRVAVATEPYPGRWTHHIPLASPQELDEELLGWVHAAYDFAESKGHRGEGS